MQNFMPWHGLAGGVVIGLSAAFYLLAAGKVSGISGILEDAMTPSFKGVGERFAYIAGLPAGALAVGICPGPAITSTAIAGPRFGNVVSFSGAMVVGIMLSWLLPAGASRLATPATEARR